jgi:restriction endonuclease Mrr
VINRHRDFGVVVLDEAQNIKNSSTGQAKSCKALKRHFSWALSGTPIENSLSDLVSIFDFVRPGLLFANDGPSVAKNRIKPHFLRRRKEDVLKQLPPKVRIEQWLQMEGSQWEAYERAESEGVAELKKLGETITLDHVLKLLTALKQICNRDVNSGESVKLEFLQGALEDLTEQGNKALIFTQYKNPNCGVEYLVKELSQYQPAKIHGSVPEPQRNREKERFQKDDHCKVFVATQKSGGVGLTLTAGNYVFHFDHWWNPATTAQAEDRAHRIGQKKHVFIYHLWIKDSVEERIYKILEKKKQLYAEVIDGLSNVKGTGLSEEELFSLFGLKSPRAEKTKLAAEKAKSEEDLLDRVISAGPVRFEEICEILLSRIGFKAKRTSQSRDGGIDVVAEGRDGLGETELLAVQCKCYPRDHVVGPEHTRAFYGVLKNPSNLNFRRGLFITTARINSEAKKVAQSSGLMQLIDGSRLAQLLAKNNIEP